MITIESRKYTPDRTLNYVCVPITTSYPNMMPKNVMRPKRTILVSYICNIATFKEEFKRNTTIHHSESIAIAMVMLQIGESPLIIVTSTVVSALPWIISIIMRVILATTPTVKHAKIISLVGVGKKLLTILCAFCVLVTYTWSESPLYFGNIK